MKAFITGATGFIGAYVCQELVNKGYAVRALKRKQSRIPIRLLELDIEWVEGDILDIFSLQEGMQGCSLVYHCAGFVSLSNKDKKTMYRVNVEGTENMVNVALESGIRKFAYISSVAALNTLKETIDEKAAFTLQKRRDAYGQSKYYGEMEVWRGAAEGLNILVVNPSIVLAESDWSQGSGRFFGTLNKGLRYYPSGGTGFVDVEDVARCLVLLMESPVVNEKFILNAANLSFKDFFNLIAQKMDKPAVTRRIPKWVLSIAWRITCMYAFLTRGEPLISRFSAQSASQMHRYSNKKLVETLDYAFLPIEESIDKHVRAGLK